jgi:hypothetical protein
MHNSSWTFRPVFTTQEHSVPWRVPKTQTLSAPVPSRVPALRLPILGITPGICFLGHPTPPRLAAWSPAPALPERALGGFPRSVCPFSVTLGRYSTPYPSPRVDTTYPLTMWPNGDIPLLGLPSAFRATSRSAGSNSRRLRTFVENPVHSHLLGAVTAFG